ncbi:MAG: patatin-like phospholipase family protein [Sphaerochaetaceae bacterium]
MKRLAAIVLVCALALDVFANDGKVAVVLGGGGARGFAEIALFEKMEELGIPVDLVLGTSMGALLGSLYCVGYSPKQIISLIESQDLLNILVQPVTLPVFVLPEPFVGLANNVGTIGFSSKGIGTAPGLLGDQKLLALLNGFYSKARGIVDFDKFPVPFRAVATDAISGDRIVYERGSLITAVRSSISLPLVYPPYPQENGSLAMDGGLVDNLPIKLARDLGADYVVAMDVNALQRLKVEDLDDLTSAMVQSLVLVTQTNSVSQYPLADILLFPEVGDVETLDFASYKQIIQKGRESCEANDDKFRALAQKVQDEGRSLIVRDPNRASAYETMASRKISKVIINEKSLVKKDFVLSPSNFKAFLGCTLEDEAVRHRLNLYLDRLRISYQLATVSYEVVNDDNEDSCTLIINCNSYAKAQYKMYFAGNSSFGISNNTPASMGWFLPDISETFDLASLNKKGLDLMLHFAQGNRNRFGISAFLPCLSHGSQSFGVASAFNVYLGSLSVLSNFSYGNRNASLDWRVDVSFGCNYFFGDSIGIRILGGISYDRIHASNNAYMMPSVTLDAIWDTLRQESFSSFGLRMEGMATIGWVDSQTVFSARYRVKQGFVLQNEKQVLKYRLSFSYMRMPDELTASYVDIGGIEGLPGYSLSTFRQDTLMVDLTWQYRISSIVGSPFYLYARFATGVINNQDPFAGNFATGPLFSEKPIVDAGLLFGLGVLSSFGNYGAGLGLSVRGKICFVVGTFQ